jgi:eukaryotic-like serine/threonine-protein kinase
MPQSFEQTWQSILEHGLATEERVAELRPAWVAGHPQQTDPNALLEWLVEQGDLTRYQADVLASGSNAPLSVGPYVVIDQIASGRLAGVYRARQRTLQVPVCLKLLRPTGWPMDREEQVARFQREARVSIQVDHPHVVRTWQVGQDGDTYFLAFEDLWGQSLAELLDADNARAEGDVTNADWLWSDDRTRTWPPEVCRVIREAALGLAHMHDQGIVHRDVCPANIWVSADGLVKVMDFGMARDALSYIDSPLTEEQAAGPSGFVGSTDYLSLEQALDAESAGPQSDVYSLGCTLYHALTGRVPFPAATPARQMLLHATQVPPPPSQLNPDVRESLDEVVAGMMSKTTADRYPDCGAVAAALQPFADEAEHPPHEVVQTPALLDFMRWLDEEAFVYSKPTESKPASKPTPTRHDHHSAAWPTDEPAAAEVEPAAPAWRLAPIRTKKVLFATDFSKLSDAALSQAAALCRDSQAKLLIVHVEEPPAAYGAGDLYYGLPDPDQNALRRMLDEVKPDDPAIDVERHLLIGDPASEIAALAAEQQVDLIVIGTHGRSGLSRLLIGSTAESIVRKAPCAVLTVKMPHR